MQKTATTFSNYGVAYPLQSKKIRNKMEKTMLETYGVTHNSFRKETIEERKKTWLEKYGVNNPLFISDKGFSKISQDLFWKLYEKIPKDLKEKCYFYELNKEFDIEDYENKIHYLYDFVISNIKLCIEFNGDFWHCNPKIYNEEYKHVVIGKTAREIWEKDSVKINFLKKKGYSVFVVWESEYKESPHLILDSLLKLVLT